MLTLARVAMGFQFQAVGATSTFVQARYGIDLAGIGVLVGIYLLPGIVLALPSGVLGARFGDRRVAAAGLLLMAAGGVACVFAPDATSFAAARGVAGVGAVAFNVLVTKMVADWFAGRGLVLAMSIAINAWPIGIGLALLVLGPLAAASGLIAALALVAFSCLLAWLLLVAGYAPPPAAVAPGGAARPGLRALDAREWRLLGLSGAAWASYNAMYAGLASFLPAWLIERGAGVAQAGALAALNTILIVVAVPVGGVLVHRTGRPLAVLTAGLVGGSIALAALLHGGPTTPLLVLAGFLYGLAAGIIAALPGQFLRADSRAVGMGVFMTLYYAGLGVLPASMGWVAARTGTAAAALWLALAFALGALALAAAAGRRSPAPVTPRARSGR